MDVHVVELNDDNRTDLEALHRALDANPADQAIRLVLADWYDEHERDVECPLCKGVFDEFRGTFGCKHCSGTGYASNGCAERAEFLRWMAVEGKYPESQPDLDRHSTPSLKSNTNEVWHRFWRGNLCVLPEKLFELLEAMNYDEPSRIREGRGFDMAFYTNRQRAEDALFEAWRKWREQR